MVDAMNCAACGKPAPEHHDTYHFSGDKAHQFWICDSDACFWRIVWTDVFARAREASR